MLNVLKADTSNVDKYFALVPFIGTLYEKFLNKNKTATNGQNRLDFF